MIIDAQAHETGLRRLRCARHVIQGARGKLAADERKWLNVPTSSRKLATTSSF